MIILKPAESETVGIYSCCSMKMSSVRPATNIQTESTSVATSVALVKMYAHRFVMETDSQ